MTSKVHDVFLRHEKPWIQNLECLNTKSLYVIGLQNFNYSVSFKQDSFCGNVHHKFFLWSIWKGVNHSYKDVDNFLTKQHFVLFCNTETAPRLPLSLFSTIEAAWWNFSAFKLICHEELLFKSTSSIRHCCTETVNHRTSSAFKL